MTTAGGKYGPTSSFAAKWGIAVAVLLFGLSFSGWLTDDPQIWLPIPSEYLVADANEDGYIDCVLEGTAIDLQIELDDDLVPTGDTIGSLDTTDFSDTCQIESHLYGRSIELDREQTQANGGSAFGFDDDRDGSLEYFCFTDEPIYFYPSQFQVRGERATDEIASPELRDVLRCLSVQRGPESYGFDIDFDRRAQRLDVDGDRVLDYLVVGDSVTAIEHQEPLVRQTVPGLIVAVVAGLLSWVAALISRRSSPSTATTSKVPPHTERVDETAHEPWRTEEELRYISGTADSASPHC